MNDSMAKLMEAGYNIFLECKGKGRVYEMTFEGTLSKAVPDKPTIEELVEGVYTLAHAVGNSVEDVCDQLLEQVSTRKQV